MALLLMAALGANATDYYVVGTMNNWTPSSQYKMELNTGAAIPEYQLGVYLPAGAELKVVGVDGENKTWFPDGTENYGESNPKIYGGLYTIYFRPGYGGPEDWFNGCIYVVEGATSFNLTEVTPGKEWSLSQPDFNVELEVEYYPRATLTTTPAATTGDIFENTTTALITAGASEEGTIYYAVSTSNATAPTDGWSTDVPTAEGRSAATYYIWYKVVGDDTHSNSVPQYIAVTIAAIPTYAVTIDDGNVDAANWEADPTEQKAGEKVKLTYKGKKKIKSITIEAAE